MTKITDIRSEFPHAAGYLNSASAGMAPLRTAHALRAAVEQWELGRLQTPDWDPPVNEARARFARLVNVGADRVAVGDQLSVMAGTIAASLSAGAKVITAQGDFTSLLWPFLEQAGMGTITVENVPLDEVVDAIDDSTSWVAVSAVQSRDGKLVDLERLAQRAKATGTRVLIDATQAVGWLPIDASHFDVVACAAYKWLMCPRGIGFMTIREGVQPEIRSINAGWYAGDDPHTSYYGEPLRLATDARRFDLSPAWMLWPAASVALGLIHELGIDTIHQHDVGLANAFLEQIGREPSNSAIVSIEADDETQKLLMESGLRCAMRDGRVRLSFHLFNDEGDVKRAASCWFS